MYRWWYRRRGLPADRLLVDSFILLDPWWTLHTGAVPYWSFFPVQPSIEALHRYLDVADPYDFLHLSLLCHGVHSVGMATAYQWRGLLRRASLAGTFAGVSPSRYPSDLLRSLTPESFAFHKPTRLVQVGDSAGPNLTLPAGSARTSGVEIYGAARGMRVAMGEVYEQIVAWTRSGELTFAVEAVPLSDIGTAWQRTDLRGRRLFVLT